MLLRDLFVEAGERALDVNRALLDALNVFPVPDGDTGTNMLLTLRYVLKSSASDAEGLYRACLLGAQGNSGLLMSHLFKGFARAAGASGELDRAMLAAAFGIARREAVSSIPNPREGTIITVYGEVAARLERAALDGGDLAGALELAYEQALDTVRRTPEMLPILREAGVVDSGGLGIAILLRGALNWLKGVDAGGLAQDVTELGIAATARVGRDFVHAAQEEEWGYCTGFALRGGKLAVDAIKAELEPLGRSFLLLGDEQLAKIHIHAEDPGVILSSAIKYGALSDIVIKNMTLQATDWAEQQAEGAETGDADGGDEALTTGVVAVATGRGLMGMFRDMVSAGLTVLDGGQLMNPNVEQVLAAVRGVSAGDVLVLPNNKDAIGVSEAAAKLATDKRVKVLRTDNMAAGLVGLVEFDEANDLEHNYKQCLRATERAVYGSVSRAVSSTKLDGVDARAGDYIAFVNGKMVLATDSADDALLKVLAQQELRDAVVCVYHSATVSDEQARALADKLESLAPQAEALDVFDGGQPHYDYIFSLER